MKKGTRSEPTHDVRVLYDLKAPMRDGITLSTDVYLPRESGAFPAILWRTPYESTAQAHIEWAVWFASRGYAAAVQDTRGKFESGGTFYAYHNEGKDGHDTLAWMANQPWCNGRIGMNGRSYAALVQWLTAPLGSPHLAAMAPHVVCIDFFRDCHRIGGAVQWLLTILGAVLFPSSIHLIQRGCTHLFGNQRFYRHLPLIDADVAAIGRKIDFYRDWAAHPFYDDYWKEVNAEERVEQIDVPTYQQGGWYDPYVGCMFRMWNSLRQRAGSELARKNQKIWIGPWSHAAPDGSESQAFGPDAYVDVKAEDLRWFDAWLKGVDDGITDEPPVRIFVMGENVWRFEEAWPLARTAFTRYYLHSDGNANSLDGDGRLSTTPPGDEPPDRYDYDPQHPVPTLGGNNSTWTMVMYASDPVLPGPLDQRPVEGRDDVLVYTGERLERDLEVTGPLEVVLYAETSARDTDFTAKLVDVHPDGRAIHLAEGIIRARHRNGLEREDPVEPGRVERYQIELAPTSNLFLEGHRLRVEISSSNFPRFDRNLNTGEDIFTGVRMEVAHQTILHTEPYPSHVLLPIIPRN